MKNMFVYIATNRTRTLYIGVTSNLEKRMAQHRDQSYSGFTAKYNIDKLVYFEHGNSSYEAIAREKVLKGWKRERKIALIESMNPGWKDLLDSSLRSE